MAQAHLSMQLGGVCTPEEILAENPGLGLLEINVTAFLSRGLQVTYTPSEGRGHVSIWGLKNASYAGATTVLKLGGGLAMALVMNQHFRGKNLARALLLLPFIVPTVLSTIAWMWILDPTFSVVNWLLVRAGVITSGFSWLGNATLAMVSIVVVNTWRGMPFYGITLLAGLQTISPDLYEAAAIDGATTRQRFWHVTMPLIKPVLVIVTMFSVIFTFSDFQLIYALTHGGPANATHVFSTWAFDIGMSAGQLGMGAAVALAMLPALTVLIVGLTIYLRRE